MILRYEKIMSMMAHNLAKGSDALDIPVIREASEGQRPWLGRAVCWARSARLIRWTALAGVILILLSSLVQTAQETAAAPQAAPEAPPLENQNDKLSYALGIDFGNQLRSYSVEIDLDLLMRGLRDAQARGKTLLTEEEVRAALNDLRSGLRKKQLALQNEKLLKTANDGEAFLAENKAKEGVVTLESGLQYKILKAGDGKKPTIDDTVVCHFRGTHIDGTEFANSYKSTRPATFAIKRVIKGWTEALQLMPVGSKWQLFVPSNLAYGERGAGRRIGPNATVIFEVELISIKDRTAPVHSVGSKGPDDKVVSAAPALTAIKLSFKLNPQLTKGLYMGERWVSPPKYMSAQAGKSITVEARAHGVDAKGKPRTINPTWTPADPEMVTVTPNEGNAVTITVHRAGESSLRVASQGVVKELPIKAVYQGNVIQVEIAQKP
jgi:FKBP-type peptidyl-prolyl cis-trans isomerase